MILGRGQATQDAADKLNQLISRAPGQFAQIHQGQLLDMATCGMVFVAYDQDADEIVAAVILSRAITSEESKLRIEQLIVDFNTQNITEILLRQLATEVKAKRPEVTVIEIASGTLSRSLYKRLGFNQAGILRLKS
jgi:superfamily II DNA or RNA helicase